MHRTATRCNERHTLQHTATHCNTMQYTATRCNTRHILCTTCSLRNNNTLFSDSPPPFQIVHSLHRPASHCNTLQHTATVGTHSAPPVVYGSTLRFFQAPLLTFKSRTLPRCTTLQHPTTPWKTLQHPTCSSLAPFKEAVCCHVVSVLQCTAVCCSVLQCVAVCCSVLQRIAVYCSMLQCVAVCCSVRLSSRAFSRALPPPFTIEEQFFLASIHYSTI